MRLTVSSSSTRPLACQHCIWIGFDVGRCPDCDGPVQAMGQKGLDKLRRQHHLLGMAHGFQKQTPREIRWLRRAQIEVFFERLGITVKP